jgi:opacity protein-like surface antigen
MPYKLTRVALTAMMLYAATATATAAAVDVDMPMFSFGGFGTLGVVHSSEHQADFTASIFKPSGAGYTRSWSASVDSLIAAQVTANFTPRLSAVLQVISEQNYDNTYKPHVEWANIKYQFTPDFSIRVGRSVLPIFLVSDTTKVGYTYPSVRLPLEVYGLLSITNGDVLGMSYRLHVGEWTNTVQANVGSKDSNLVTGGVAEANDAWTISNLSEYGPLTIRISYTGAKVTIASFNPLFDAFRQLGPQGIAIADK